MSKKTRVLLLIFAALFSVSVGATSIGSQFAQPGSGPAHEYLGHGMPGMPLGGGDGDPLQYDVPIFVRGGFNDWGLANEMIYQGEGIYEVIISLGIGGWEFKVASEDWATVDLGSINEDPTVDLGVPLVIGFASFSNLFVDIAVAGLYSFVLDTSLPGPTQSPSFPTLTVSLFQAMPMPVPGTLALIGLGLLFFARVRKTH